MDIDKILSEELGKIGAIGGAIGGSFTGGVTAVAGSIGGKSGASLASKFLPTETYFQEIAFPENLEDSLRSTLKTLSEMEGVKLREHSELEGPGFVFTIGSGFLNMNPCLVIMEVTSSGNGQTKMNVTGAAKEGFIKQNTSRKAVTKIVDRMSQFRGHIT
jgi:hypothetical protein